jgi:hypothetical protein
MQRSNHLLAARQAMDGLGYAADYRLERLPKAALDLILATASVKQRARERR